MASDSAISWTRNVDIDPPGMVALDGFELVARTKIVRKSEASSSPGYPFSSGRLALDDRLLHCNSTINLGWKHICLSLNS
jgi:hypothetical protein